jgi:thiamine-monophosphate kinase
MPSEFELIRRYFSRPAGHTVLSVGDDGAVIRPRPGMDLVVSTDMLVAGTHFLPGTDPKALGWKALAVNLSDLAAMGAEPRWAVLAAALPEADEPWIAAFADGFFACAARHGVDVIGGDTTRGPLNLAPTVFGEVPVGQALTRTGAGDGDDIWVSGAPGRAGLGLAELQGRVCLPEPVRAACLAALHRPQPRVELGMALRGVATATIDVSDGLLADLGHILESSGCAARLDEFLLPEAPELAACPDRALVWSCLTAGGDDYELVFTAPSARVEHIRELSGRLGLTLTRIGSIRAGSPGVIEMRGADGTLRSAAARGYDHFA